MGDKDVLGGGEILGGGVVLGGGNILDGGVVLGVGDIFFFLCFISSFGRRRQFGWRRGFG